MWRNPLTMYNKLSKNTHGYAYLVNFDILGCCICPYDNIFDKLEALHFAFQRLSLPCHIAINDI